MVIRRGSCLEIDSSGIGMVVLTAGPLQAWTKLQDATLSMFLPAFDEHVRVQVRQSESNFRSADKLVEIVLKTDNGLGFELDKLSRNSPDLLTAFIARYLKHYHSSATCLPILACFQGTQTRIHQTPADNTSILVRKGDWLINLVFRANTADNPGSNCSKPVYHIITSFFSIIITSPAPSS